MVGSKLQSYAGLAMASGAAIGAFVGPIQALGGDLTWGTIGFSLAQHPLTYLAAAGAAMAAFGSSLRPRNGAQTRATDPPPPQQKGASNVPS